MIDPFDTKTVDAFDKKRGRGRPRTSSAEKRKADTAERQRRFRARQKIKTLAMTKFAETGSRDWMEFITYLGGGNASTEGAEVTYKKGRSPHISDVTWAELEALFLDESTTDIEFRD